MPLLSQLLYAAIITHLLSFSSQHPWYHQPPPIPPLVKVHAWFISEWNKGIYPAPKQRHYWSGFHKPPWSFPHIRNPVTNTWAPQLRHEELVPIIDVKCTTFDQSNPEYPRSDIENLHFQAYLNSLTTPGTNNKIQFDSDAEHTCIDTGLLGS
jgi:hypothetical protein